MNTQDRVALNILQRRYPIEGASLSKCKFALLSLQQRLESLGKDHPNYRAVLARKADIAHLVHLLTDSYKEKEPA